MAGRAVTQVDVLQQYVTGVMDRADHHAGSVNEVCLTIAGALIWRKNGDIHVFEREGNLTNALWVNIGTNRYAISYKHETGKIEIRENNMRGKVLREFDNSDSASDVRKFFATL
ncbi:MAG: hypothetical protein WDZ51_01725 [Pirellulaceae bacterium]